MTLFKIRGKVKKGAHRGAALGFPTANIPLHKKIPTGIYISETLISGKNFQSITFIGNAITFHETNVCCETYLLSFDENIYNTWITVHLLKKIRENKKFETVEKLVSQMKKDKEQTEAYFKKHV